MHRSCLAVSTMIWHKLRGFFPAVSTTVCRPQKQLTACYYREVQRDWVSHSIPTFPTLFTSFYPLHSVHLSPEESPSAQHFDRGGQKMKAVRTEREEKCCSLRLHYKTTTALMFSYLALSRQRYKVYGFKTKVHNCAVPAMKCILLKCIHCTWTCVISYASGQILKINKWLIIALYMFFMLQLWHY